MSTEPPAGPPHPDPHSPSYPDPPSNFPHTAAAWAASGPPPAPAGGSAAAGGPAGASGAAPRTGGLGSPGGFFAALFDFSFSRFITPMIIRFVYVLAAGMIGLLWFVLLITGFASGPAEGLVVLLLGPIVAVIYLAFVRMTLEIYLAIVRMSEDIHQRLPRG